MTTSKSASPPYGAVFVMLLLVGILLEAVVPLLLGRTLEAALRDLRMGLFFVAVMAVTAGLIVALSVTRHVVGGRWSIRRQTEIREVIGRVLAKNPEALSRAVGSSMVGTVLGSDVSRVAAYPLMRMRWFASIVGMVVVAAYLLTISLPLGALVLVGVPLFVWLTARLSEPIEARQDTLRDHVGRLAAMSSDITLGLRTLWAVGARRAFLSRLETENRSAQRAGLRLATMEAVLLATGSFLPGVLLTVLVAVGGVLLQREALPATALVSFYAAATYLTGPVQTTANLLPARSAARVAQRRIDSVLLVEADDSSDAEPSDLDWPIPGNGVVVVHVGEQREGEVDVLARRVAGALQGRAGNGRPASLRVQYQKPAVFSGTVRELVDPWGNATDEEVLAAIRDACADDVVERLPHGVDEVVGEGGRRLSGGQRQRLVLARTMLGATGDVVLVEPTTALDVATEAELAARLLERRRQASATVIIADTRVFDEGAGAVVETGDLR